MLSNSVVCAAVPVADVDRARRFYGETLSLTEAPMGDADEAFYLVGARTKLADGSSEESGAPR